MTVRVVGFAGRRAGTTSLTWGQRHIWDAIRRLDGHVEYLNLSFTVPVPTGCSLDRVLACLGRLIERHEALRTLYREGSDGPCQVVLRTGSLTVEVHEAGADDGSERAELLRSGLAAHQFDLARELPLRCAVIARDGRPASVIMVLCHQSVDGASGRSVERSLAEALTDRTHSSGDTDDWQPLDQARHEQTPSIVKRGQMALQYWRRGLLTAPWSLFDAPTLPAERDRYVRYRLDSPAIAVAAGMLAERHRVSSSTVLLTAMAVLLRTYTGHPVIPLKLVTGNRLGPRHRALVSTLAQDALLIVDLAGMSFNRALQATYDASVLAYRHAYYDPMLLETQRMELENQRGVALDLSVVFNDARVQRESAETSWRSPASSRPILGTAGEISLVGSWPRHDSKVFLHVDQKAASFQLYLLTDTAHLPNQETIRFLRGMETLLVQALEGDLPASRIQALTGLDARVRGSGWCRHGSGWVRPGTVSRILVQASGTDAAAAFISTSPSSEGSPQLVGYIANTARRIQLCELHASVVAGLAGHTDAVAPDLYVLCDGAPTDHQDVDQWSALPVIDSGDGRVSADRKPAAYLASQCDGEAGGR